MERRQVAALTPLRRGSMVSHFEEDRELFERRQRRDRLAEDLMEDALEESDLETDDGADEMAPAPPAWPRAARWRWKIGARGPASWRKRSRASPTSSSKRASTTRSACTCA